MGTDGALVLPRSARTSKKKPRSIPAPGLSGFQPPPPAATTGQAARRARLGSRFKTILASLRGLAVRLLLSAAPRLAITASLHSETAS
ncbi:MAG TPA: hypothetical protein DD502_07020 [Cupriavidus sp.]|nr:hypothetical protein [Cupriavidus sp.]